MKTAKLPSRDRRENRFEREEKLSKPSETLPGKTLADQDPRAHRFHLQSDRFRSQRPSPRADLRPEKKADREEARRGICFRLQLPEAKSVCVAGTFNRWNTSATPLTRGALGEWSVELALTPGAYEYRFIVDGTWQDDPCASHVVSNPFGTSNAVILVA